MVNNFIESVFTKECPCCEQRFIANRVDKKFCSHKCSSRFSSRKMKGNPVTDREMNQQVKRMIPKDKKNCLHCNKEFHPFRITLKFCSSLCSSKYHYAQNNSVIKIRQCRECSKEFEYLSKGRLHYCSDECSAIANRRKKAASAKASREFMRQNPEKIEEYKERAKNKNPKQYSKGLTRRFFDRYPDRKKECESCGETRIVELAHKIPRMGACRTLKNTKSEDVWILCPTCHRCLDFGIQTKEELGIQ